MNSPKTYIIVTQKEDTVLVEINVKEVLMDHIVEELLLTIFNKFPVVVFKSCQHSLLNSASLGIISG